MKQTKTISLLLVVVTVLLLGIAYAAIGNLPFVVTGNATAAPSQENFRVTFGKVGTSDAPTFAVGAGTSAGVNVTFTTPSDRTAKMDVTGLKKVGDSVTAIFKVINESTDLDASLTDLITYGTNNYFTVTSEAQDKVIAAQQKTNVEVTVTLVKLPVTSNAIANISVDFYAVPIEKGAASVAPYFTVIDGYGGNTLTYDFTAGQNWAEFVYTHSNDFRIGSDSNIEWKWNGDWRILSLITHAWDEYIKYYNGIIHGGAYLGNVINTGWQGGPDGNNFFMP